MPGPDPHRSVRDAFAAECTRLSEVLATLDDADLTRPTDCPPWNLAQLLAHVHTGVGRLTDMLADPAPAQAHVDAAEYFGTAKFTPQVDADRIASAQASADVDSASRLAAEFDRAWRATLTAVDAYPPDRVVRTRHGDAMTVTEFLRTRVLEVGVHGLDLAAALDRPAWLAPAAARVIADLLTGGRDVPGELGWDRLTLIAKATGRSPRSAAEQALLDSAGLRLLSFGRR
ncbi:maleylpyruvate isomerase N-terminal domain-containing protein [Micromonospora sp. NPDC003816]|uniref:maleylpyruvate isomerase N-terminal domain-containing protein n=1 Tax=Micromonospora sp. NPDC003816 TaxID=3364224 RepID=UPI00369A8189